MPKVLLLLVQSHRAETYVNVLTHCITHEDVETVVFVGREGLSEESYQLEGQVQEICHCIRQLANDRELYKPVVSALPADGKVESRIAFIDFVHPYRSIAALAKRFGEPDSVIVDITAVSTEVSANIITSIPITGLKHVCYLTLNDSIYRHRTAGQPGSLLYHELAADPNQRQYSYQDIADSPSTHWAQRQIRVRGVLAGSFLVTSALLMSAVVLLLGAGKMAPAQVAAVLSVVATVAGLATSIASLSGRLAKLIGRSS